MNSKKIYSVINQKGGVGKTTTTINLGTAMAACGAQVLLIDLDPQGNLSTGLGIEKADRNNGTYDILINKSSVTKLHKETAVPNLHVITANENLLGLDIELANSSDRATRLRESLLEELNYDFILLDCPPALNILTINALVASL